MPKLMPTLRHTKSEEYLESNVGSSSDGNSEVKIHIEKVSDNAISIDNVMRDWSDDDVWSQEEDEITAQYLNMQKISEKDSVSEVSLESIDSREQGAPSSFNIGDVRMRHCINLYSEIAKPFSNDPEDPSAAALKVSKILNKKRSNVVDFCIFSTLTILSDSNRNRGMTKNVK